MSERNTSRLPFHENNSNTQIPVRTTWRQRPPTQQQPALSGLAEQVLFEEHRGAQLREEYMDEIAEENDEKIAIIEGQRVKILDASCYTQMRKSEFFSKRLKKDSSATRLTAIHNQRIASQQAPGVRFGGSQQNWMPGSAHPGLKPLTQKETVSTTNPTLTVIKPNQRKLMIASRDLKNVTEAAAHAEWAHGHPDLHHR